MKKYFATILTTSCFCFVLSQECLAVPTYYTFEGSVVNSWDQVGGVTDPIVDSGLLKYTVMVDFEEQGEMTRNDGTVAVFPDVPIYEDEYKKTMYDFFYVDFVCGTVMSEVNGGYFNSDSDAAEFNYGEIFKRVLYQDGPNNTNAMTGNDTTHTSFLVLGSDDFLTFDQFFTGNDPGYTEWMDPDFSIGSEWITQQRVMDENGNEASVVGQMALTSISLEAPDCDTNPVPEPATLLLFGTGMAGVAGFRTRRKK